MVGQSVQSLPLVLLRW